VVRAVNAMLAVIPCRQRPARDSRRRSQRRSSPTPARRTGILHPCHSSPSSRCRLRPVDGC